VSETRFSRKQMLGRTAGAAVGLSVVGALTNTTGQAGASTHATISGRVVAQPGDDRTISIESEGRVLSVTALPGAHVWRDALTTLSMFAIGDEVSAVGHWKGDAFFAHELTPLFRPVDGIVAEIHGNRFRVGEDIVVIDSTTRFRRVSDHRLQWLRPRLPRRGETLNALTRRDAGSGHLVARQVYVNE
jgi:hypothetical protein